MTRATFEEIREALAYVPAHDRDLWLRMAMAIKSELRRGCGAVIWDEWWSQQDESYSPLDAKGVWKSIKVNGRITIGTLFYEAQRHGFRLNGHARPAPPQQKRRLMLASGSAKPRKPRMPDAARKLLESRKPSGKLQGPRQMIILIWSARASSLWPACERSRRGRRLPCWAMSPHPTADHWLGDW